MRDYDERFEYRGIRYKSLDGLVNAVAVENGIDERDLDDVKKEILERCDGDATFVVDVEDLADAILDVMSGRAPEV